MSSRSPVASVEADLVFRRLSARIGELAEVGGRPIELDTRFDQLGVDSVDLLELLVWIEDSFGVELPDDDLQLPTVGDLTAALCRRLEAGQG